MSKGIITPPPDKNKPIIFHEVIISKEIEINATQVATLSISTGNTYKKLLLDNDQLLYGLYIDSDIEYIDYGGNEEPTWKTIYSGINLFRKIGTYEYSVDNIPFIDSYADKFNISFRVQRSDIRFLSKRFEWPRSASYKIKINSFGHLTAGGV